MKDIIPGYVLEKAKEEFKGFLIGNDCLLETLLYLFDLYLTDHQQPVLPGFFRWSPVNTRKNLASGMIDRQSP